MTATSTLARADAKAQQLADTFNRQADAHEQAAAAAGDEFESAAHQGAARDLRERARQALSQTEAAQRAAQAQAAHEQRQADATARAADTKAAYEQAAAEYIAGEQNAVDTVLRAANDLTQRADTLTRARAAAEQAAAAAQTPAPPDLIEAHVRGLLARNTPERAGLVHAARTSPAMLAPRLGAVASQIADARGGRGRSS